MQTFDNGPGIDEVSSAQFACDILINCFQLNFWRFFQPFRLYCHGRHIDWIVIDASIPAVKKKKKIWEKNYVEFHGI